MSAAKDVYEKQVGELCSQIRTLSLEIAEIESQHRDLATKREDRLGRYGQLKDLLYRKVQEAVMGMGLAGSWACDLSTGKLVPRDG